VMTGRCYS